MTQQEEPTLASWIDTLAAGRKPDDGSVKIGGMNTILLGSVDSRRSFRWWGLGYELYDLTQVNLPQDFFLAVIATPRWV